MYTFSEVYNTPSTIHPNKERRQTRQQHSRRNTLEESLRDNNKGSLEYKIQPLPFITLTQLMLNFLLFAYDPTNNIKETIFW